MTEAIGSAAHQAAPDLTGHDQALLFSASGGCHGAQAGTNAGSSGGPVLQFSRGKQKTSRDASREVQTALLPEGRMGCHRCPVGLVGGAEAHSGCKTNVSAHTILFKEIRLGRAIPPVSQSPSTQTGTSKIGYSHWAEPISMISRRRDGALPAPDDRLHKGHRATGPQGQGRASHPTQFLYQPHKAIDRIPATSYQLTSTRPQNRAGRSAVSGTSSVAGSRKRAARLLTRGPSWKFRRTVPAPM